MNRLARHIYTVIRYRYASLPRKVVLQFSKRNFERNLLGDRLKLKCPDTKKPTYFTAYPTQIRGHNSRTFGCSLGICHSDHLQYPLSKQQLKKMSLINPILRARNPLSRKLPSMSKYSSEATATATFMHYFPVVGVAVGLTALTFQVLVLYPWHETISDDFQALEVSITPGCIDSVFDVMRSS